MTAIQATPTAKTRSPKAPTQMAPVATSSPRPTTRAPVAATKATTASQSKSTPPARTSAATTRPKLTRSSPSPPRDVNDVLTTCLKELHLPTFRAQFEPTARRAQRETWSYEQYLCELSQQECQVRSANRIERLLRQSQLPREKDLPSFDLGRLPPPVARHVRSLRDGSFWDRRENLLVFGRTGSGKTHLLCALAQELIRAGRKLWFSTCSLLVQELLIAKRDLKLQRVLKRLAGYDALVIDDLGYVQQSREEMEVLFTLLAERYERGSVMLTSNLPFAKWEQIFKDPMTTAAAIDRLVHHSIILELNLPSYRLEAAQRDQKRQASANPAQ